MAAATPLAAPLREVEVLSERVIRVLGLNPGPFTLQGTNTYLVGKGPRRVLIDTGEGRPGYIEALSRVMREHGVEGLDHVLLTHHHVDHWGGVPDLRRLLGSSFKVWKFSERDSQWESDPEWRAHKLKFPQLGDFSVASLGTIHALADKQILRVEGATLRAVHTPGHTSDHVAFVLEEEEAVFSGDCVLGSGTAVFADLGDYLRSLQRLLDAKPRRIYPGHGPVVDDAGDRLRMYIRHRAEREAQILAALRAAGAAAMAPEDVVKAVYKDIDASLFGGALGNVKLHLGKLVKDGSIERRTEGGRETFALARQPSL